MRVRNRSVDPHTGRLKGFNRIHFHVFISQGGNKMKFCDPDVSSVFSFPVTHVFHTERLLQFSEDALSEKETQHGNSALKELGL